MLGGRHYDRVKKTYKASNTPVAKWGKVPGLVKTQKAQSTTNNLTVSEVERWQQRNVTESRMIFSFSQLRSSSLKTKARTLSKKHRGDFKEKLGYLRHGARYQHNQHVALEPKLLRTVAALIAIPVTHRVCQNKVRITRSLKFCLQFRNPSAQCG